MEPIQYREAYLYVPYKLLLTTELAERNPELAKIMEQYDIFKAESREPDQCKLTLLLIYEYQKGEDGFWWPYLELLPDMEQVVWDLDRGLYLKEAQCARLYNAVAQEYATDGEDALKAFE